MQGLSNLLRINRPAGGPDGGAPAQPKEPLLTFAPLPGRLPDLTFHPVATFVAPIGDENLTVYRNKVTGTCWGFRRVIAKSQSGSVFVAAQVVLNAADGRYYYRLPYSLAAIKMEAKARVQESQAKLARGGHGDNSMLDRALVRFLEGTPAAPHAIRLLECWHDKDSLYSVMEYLRDGDLLDCVAANPSTRCLSESFARRAVHGALTCLVHLHSAGFMHRDISPENVMVDAQGNGVLIDFGSALPMVAAPEEAGAGAAAAGGGSGGAGVASSSAPPPAPITPHPAPLAGWHPLRPPAYGPSFCKPQYACPWYVWSRPWYGVAYDLYSVGTTLFAVLEGRTLYSAPAPGADAAFTALLESDPAAVAAWGMPGAIPTGAAGPTTPPAAGAAEGGAGGAGGGLPSPSPSLLTLLQQWNESRVAVGRARLSDEVVDLLARLLRITPACRPLSAAEVLAHPWFSLDLPEGDVEAGAAAGAGGAEAAAGGGGGAGAGSAAASPQAAGGARGEGTQTREAMRTSTQAAEQEEGGGAGHTTTGSMSVN